MQRVVTVFEHVHRGSIPRRVESDHSPRLTNKDITRASVELVATLESLSVSLCGLATILWMSIGTFSRSEGGEMFVQRLIAALCVISAILLFSLHSMGGELWGSRNVARPFAVAALIVAAAGSLNIKGTDVQGETNPHQIMKMRRAEAQAAESLESATIPEIEEE